MERVTEEYLERVKKGLEIIGTDLYYIDVIFHDKPIVKRIHISSLEIYRNGGNINLKTDHEGCYYAESIGKTLFLTREEADAKIMESYSGNVGDILNPETLKDCPICHGKAELREYSNKYAIECSACGLGTKPDYKLSKAVKLWNERK